MESTKLKDLKIRKEQLYMYEGIKGHWCLRVLIEDKRTGDIYYATAQKGDRKWLLREENE